MPINYQPLIDPTGKRTDRDGLEICGAKLRKREGLFCNRSVGLFPINRRCRMHGGKSPAGLAHYRIGTGSVTRSKHIGPYLSALPKRMLDGVEASLNDPQLLELNQEIAIVQERAADLMRRVDQGESGHLWKSLKDAFDDLQTAQGVGEINAIALSMQRMQELIEKGTADYHGWEEISRQFDRKQRLAESQRKREIELGSLAPAEQTLLMIKTLLLTVRECVTDAATREAIQRKFRTILESGIDPSRQHAFIEG